MTVNRTHVVSGPILVAVGPGNARVLRRHRCLRGSPDESREQAWLGRCAHPDRRALCSPIVSAQVILNQIGNILIFCGSATAAGVIIRRAPGGTADLIKPRLGPRVL